MKNRRRSVPLTPMELRVVQAFRQLRRRSGMSQGKFAEELSNALSEDKPRRIYASDVSHIEHGYKTPKSDIFLAALIVTENRRWADLGLEEPPLNVDGQKLLSLLEQELPSLLRNRGDSER